MCVISGAVRRGKGTKNLLARRCAPDGSPFPGSLRDHRRGWHTGL